jgi:hypothetical protein
MTLRDSIVAGKTTGDRGLDLAIVLLGELDGDFGEPWLHFEQDLQKHPGELLLLTAQWEESLVHYIFHPDNTMKATRRGHLVCQISRDKVMLGFEKQYGNVTLPIDRYVVTEQKGGSWPPVRECREPITLLELTTEFPVNRLAFYPPKPDEYVIGTEAVADKLDWWFLDVHGYHGRKVGQEISTLLGLEQIRSG